MADGPAPPRCLCIHGHFYQPPRENPWTGRIEEQPSAHPYHDWNERIAAECYAPNAAARLDGASVFVNNYARISFDFGPTLLSWLEGSAPEAYAAILEADRAAHGAMAQAYNHMILPLANDRDRATQVLWGARDFRHRFGREPEGMWLPETAVSTAALEDLAAAGIQFTVLAPRQAWRVRRFGSRQWHNVGGARVDPRRPYEVRLPSERRITVFFYDAGLAQAVAFEGALDDGARLAQRLVEALGGYPPAPAGDARLASVATDGESYGHHHRFGEMALASALRALEQRSEVGLTNYRSFLASHPPAYEVELVEHSSWSCEHGVERWRADCGCNAGTPGFHQAWRGPLRVALDWLRDQLAPAYQRAAQAYLWDPWSARNDAVALALDPSPAGRRAFLARHARYPLNPREQEAVAKLLEMQRHAMLMYTSCGWFFDDISGIEAVQILAYAARAAQLAAEVLGLDLEPELLRRLAAAPSNRPEYGTGRGVYERLVAPLKR